MNFLETNIAYLKGVGPHKFELIKKELNLTSYFDLIHYFPYRYENKSEFINVSEINEDGQYFIKGKIEDVIEKKIKTGKILTAFLSDESGTVELIWFKNGHLIKNNLKIGEIYTVYGKANDFKGKISFAHPEIKKFDVNENTSKTRLGLAPIYPLTEILKSKFIDSRFIAQMIWQIVTHSEFKLEEFIPSNVSKPLNFISRNLSYQWIHFPKNLDQVNQASKRIKFEEIFLFAMRSEKSKINRQILNKSFKINKIGHFFNTFYENYLEFELTNAQKRVIKEIKTDLNSGIQMNRLLQGDVGCGKTMVAFLCSLMAADNGFQSSLMAPTEILATQHYLTLYEWGNKIGFHVELLTGSTPTKKRKQILEDLKNGFVKLLIGTHALIEDDVVFDKYALAIIDEQHRFGVAQRAKLWNKSEIKPHVLVMTATPIPRTLAMTVHGDLDISIIDEMPKGRIPITTVHRDESRRSEVMELMRIEIKKGRQCYIVYPLIEESSKLDLNDLMNGYSMVRDYFPENKYYISILHGKMKPEEKDKEMKKFKNKQTDIMISTTVIEVGVNVPNASVMIVENANRFGLSQLHQLRGRVGRGSEKSYCVLMTKDELNPTSKKRIKALCSTNDGFILAQVDLELRGPGDILGTRQSGLPEFKLLNITTDKEIIELAKRASKFVLKNDPNLELSENLNLINYLKTQQQDNFWGRIS